MFIPIVTEKSVFRATLNPSRFKDRKETNIKLILSSLRSLNLEFLARSKNLFFSPERYISKSQIFNQVWSKKIIILFILIILCSIKGYSFYSSVGIKNSYLNDKLFYKNSVIKEDIDAFNVYKIGPIYKFQLLNLYFETYVDLGWGKTSNTFLQNLATSKSRRHFKSKERIFEYDFKLSYLPHFGPLSFGPIFTFDYNSQSISNHEHIRPLELKWYLPSLGILINLKPMAWNYWQLFCLYDFSLGRVKIERRENEDENDKAFRHELKLGTLFEIFKNIVAELDFSYSSYKSEYTQRELKKLRRESFEGSLIISLKF
jgi:hypothetical protein